MPTSHIDRVRYAFRYPFSNSDSKYGPVAKMGLALVLSVFVIPLFTFLGYLFRLSEAAARGEEEIPRFTEYVELTSDGFKGGLFLLPWFLASAIIPALPVAFLGDSIGALLGGLLTLVFGAVYPVLLVRYGLTGSFREMHSGLPTALTSSHYYAGLLILFIVRIAIAVPYALSGILIIPLLLAPFISGFFGLFTFSYLGDLLGHVYKVDGRTEQTAPA